MNYKILAMLLFTSGIANAQMFDYLKSLDKNKIEKTSIGKSINVLYDEFEIKIKDLVIWELNEVKRVQGEIDFETEDLPGDRSLEIKYRKFAELEELIDNRETELNFWYISKVDELNDLSIEKGIEREFSPHSTVNGRIIKVVIQHLLKDEKEMLKIRDYTMNTLEAASYIAPQALIVELAVQGSLEVVTDKLIQSIIEKYAEYFSFGFITEDREANLGRI